MSAESIMAIVLALLCAPEAQAGPAALSTEVVIEEVEESSAVESSAVESPYASIDISDEEKILLAKMVYAEARGESFEGQVAVAQAALNRVLSSAWGNTVTAVLTQKNQFVIGSTYTDVQMQAVEEAISSVTLPLPTDVYYFSPGKCAYGTYYTTIGNHNFYEG